jgi:hypothetical protein
MVNAAVYTKLIQVAKARTTITFAELAAAADVSLDTDENAIAMGFALDEIADQEIAAGRPLLPVVVVQGDGNRPGGGLFKYARRKGLQKTDDMTFFVTELNRVYDYWAKADAPPAPG